MMGHDERLDASDGEILFEKFHFHSIAHTRAHTHTHRRKKFNLIFFRSWFSASLLAGWKCAALFSGEELNVAYFHFVQEMDVY